MQWHQLGHMQTICTPDNHINTSSLNIYRPDALPDAQRLVSKHHINLYRNLEYSVLEIRVLSTLKKYAASTAPTVPKLQQEPQMAWSFT